jgi:hypothetical protein
MPACKRLSDFQPPKRRYVRLLMHHLDRAQPVAGCQSLALHISSLRYRSFLRRNYLNKRGRWQLPPVMSKKHRYLHENAIPLPPAWLVAPFLRSKINALSEQRRREAFVASRDFRLLLRQQD